MEGYKMKYIYANKCVFQIENKYISQICFTLLFIIYHYTVIF